MKLQVPHGRLALRLAALVTFAGVFNVPALAANAALAVELTPADLAELDHAVPPGAAAAFGCRRGRPRTETRFLGRNPFYCT